MNLDRLFHHILKPALGCTEPVAVALASAAASQATLGWTRGAEIKSRDVAGAEIRAIRVTVSRSILKNGFAIAIPNAAGHKGLLMSAALGVFCDPTAELRLLVDVRPEAVKRAEAIVEEHRVHVKVDDDAGMGVYIKAEVESGDHSGACLIAGEHSRIVALWRDGVLIYGKPGEGSGGDGLPELDELKSMSFPELLPLVDDLAPSTLELLRETKLKNMNACQVGIARPVGIGAGYFGTNGHVPTDYVQHSSALTAAGSDVRMAGYPVEIMSSAGSGNQGITATIPLVVYANAHLIEERKLLKALALSHLVTMYLTTKFGYLSAFCGVAIKAGMGAACGLTCLMGGGAEELERSVKIMAATLTGMICDGAKAGCALKVSTAAEIAMRVATLSVAKAEVPHDNGIVGATADATIDNLAILNRSMETVDRNIIQIMLDKVGDSASAL